MAPRKSKEPEVVTPLDEFWQLLAIARRELTVAAIVAGGLTLMFLVHRYTTAALGAGVLHAGIFGGGNSIDELVANVESFVTRREEEKHARRDPPQQQQRTRTD